MEFDHEIYKGYSIDYQSDPYGDSPAEWGNYEIVTFPSGYASDSKTTDISDSDWHKYATESNKLTPAIQAKMRAGKAFAIRYTEHGLCNYDALEGVRTHTHGISGLIIFTDEYAKNHTDYAGRFEMAQQDLETYTAWANGDVWGFVLTDPYGEEWDDNTSWGYYGMDDARQAAQDGIERHLSYDKPQYHTKPAGELHE